MIALQEVCSLQEDAQIPEGGLLRIMTDPQRRIKHLTSVLLRDSEDVLMGRLVALIYILWFLTFHSVRPPPCRLLGGKSRAAELDAVSAVSINNNTTTGTRGHTGSDFLLPSMMCSVGFLAWEPDKHKDVSPQSHRLSQEHLHLRSSVHTAALFQYEHVWRKFGWRSLLCHPSPW